MCATVTLAGVPARGGDIHAEAYDGDPHLNPGAGRVRRTSDHGRTVPGFVPLHPRLRLGGDRRIAGLRPVGARGSHAGLMNQV